jgi:hypothetical protein
LKQTAHHIGEHVDGRLAALMDAVGKIGSLRCLAALERAHFHAVFLREAHRCRRRLAIRLVGGRDGRTGDQFLMIGLPLGQLRDTRGQPARRAVALRGCVGVETRVLEARVEMRRQLPRQSRQPAGRNLLAADFDEQFAIHGHVWLAAAG